MDVETVRRIAYDLMTKEQAREFENELEMNLSHLDRAIGNFRINIFRQRGSIALVIRYVRSNVPPFEALKLPPVLLDLVMEKRGPGARRRRDGLRQVDHARRDDRPSQHEPHRSHPDHRGPDRVPVQHQKSLVNQREIGVDTHNYHMALQNALREAPDLIMIGEIRDKETMQAALLHTLTGHLCLSTIHANNSYHALSRIINLFPHDVRSAVLSDLSIGLRAIVSQRLVRNTDGALQPAVEILLNTSLIAELIKNGEFTQIKEAMEQSLYPGSQTFEQALCRLYLDEQISYDEAMIASDSPTNLAWLINQNSPTTQDGEDGDQGAGNVRIDRGLRQHDDRSRDARAVAASRTPLRPFATIGVWMSPRRRPLALARELIARRSLTPDDAGCQPLLAARLAPLGFRCETLRSNGVTNLWARLRRRRPARLLRRPHRRRADRTARRVAQRPVRADDPRRLPVRPRCGGHEGFARGVRRRDRVVPRRAPARGIDRAADHVRRGRSVDRRHGQGRRAGSQRDDVRIDYCVVGEPSSVTKLGDMIKNGRRGTLSGTLTVKGVQGHIAYPHLARNPIHLVAPALAELSSLHWDDGNDYFPPTTFQCSNIHAGTGATNVIPGTLELQFNFRYSTASTRESLARRFDGVLDAHGLDYDLAWTGHGEPFLTREGPARRHCRRRHPRRKRASSPSSRAPAARPTAASSHASATRSSRSVPSTHTIHKLNERVATADLERARRDLPRPSRPTARAGAADLRVTNGHRARSRTAA